MDTSTLTPTVAATLSSSAKAAHAGNRNLNTNPQRMAVIKVWDSMMRGAHKYCEEQRFVPVHSGVGAGMARVAQFILSQTDIRECVSFLINRDNVL